MGEIVIAAGASHAPGITGMPEAADPEQSSRFYAGMERMRQAFEKAKPEVIIEISNDHLFNFYLNNMPAICIGTGQKHTGPYEPWIGMDQRTLTGHPDLARDLLVAALDEGLPLSFSEELYFGHAELVPLHFLTPKMDIPVIPIMINDFVNPLPPLRAAYRLGQVIRQVVEGRPKGERVAVVGTGGLSHWVGVPEMGKVNSNFDQRFLDELEHAHASGILEYTQNEIDAAGNGAHEIRNWIGVMGAMPEARVEVLTYEPIVPWVTGCAGVVWEP